MTVKRSMPLWGKVLWGLGILDFAERQFEAFGYKHVNVVVEHPGLRRTVNDNGGRNPGLFSKE